MTQTPEILDYAAPVEPRGASIVRAIKCSALVVIPAVFVLAWSELGVQWCIQTGRAANGNPSDATWSAFFIDRPFLLLTGTFVTEALFLGIQVVRRKLAPSWLWAIPAILVVWFVLGVRLAVLSDRAFP